MIKTMNEKAIEDVLRREIIGRLGCHADGVTYVVPLSYAYDGEYIYCHGYEGMKMEMMRKNPDVCFQVDNMQNMANWQSVIIWGKFEELQEGKDKEYALDQLLNRIAPAIPSQTLHLGKNWPFHPDNMKEIGGVVFRIRPEKKTGKFEMTDEMEYYAT